MKILNWLARKCGWSSIGKAVVFKIEDAVDESFNGIQLAGTVAEINSDGSAIIALDSQLTIKGVTATSVIAVPRHKNYDFSSLWTGFIAVNLLLPAKISSENWIATATLKRV